MIVPKSETYKGYKITVFTKYTADGTFIGKTMIAPQYIGEIVGVAPFEIGEFVSYETNSDPLIDLFRSAETKIDRWYESGMNTNIF